MGSAIAQTTQGALHSIAVCVPLFVVVIVAITVVIIVIGVA